MTMPIDAIVALGFAAGFLVIFYGPWQEACTDFARQYMFEKRDRLFDIAADGHMSFDSPEYRTLRGQIESHIRYAHDFALPRLVVLMAVMQRHEGLPQPPRSLAETVESIENPTVRAEVRKLVTDASMALLLMALAKSIVFAAPLLVLLLVAYCTKTYRALVNWLEGRSRVAALTETVQRGARLAS